jgi:ABC-2 type transport system ATP-binding protein
MREKRGCAIRGLCETVREWEKEIEMNLEYAIEGKDIQKKYKGFVLDVSQVKIPKGFATALIGENGAGKTTLMNILAGIRLDYHGQLSYFGEYDDKAREENPVVKELIGYTGPGSYYLPQWRIQQISEISELLFSNFHRDRFISWCERLHIGADVKDLKKKVSALSDGNRMKLMIAGALARDTKLLLMDEPASPLDPMMREHLCELIRDYLMGGRGESSVFFSTHNIADMENVTDYAIIMSAGRIVEEGFVDDLKEKYVAVKGEPADAARAKEVLYSINAGKYGFEGICLAEKIDQLAGYDVVLETPSLTQISVAVMKKYARG